MLMRGAWEPSQPWVRAGTRTDASFPLKCRHAQLPRKSGIRVWTLADVPPGCVLPWRRAPGQRFGGADMDRVWVSALFLELNPAPVILAATSLLRVPLRPSVSMSQVSCT